MNALPVILGLAAALFLAASDLTSRVASRSVGSFTTASYVQTIGIVPLLILVVLLGVRSISSPFILIAMTSLALLNFVALFFLYSALRNGVVSVVAPIAYSYPAISTVLGAIFLGESISSSTIISLGAIMAGTILVSTRLSELRTHKIRSAVISVGVTSAVISAILAGLIFFGLKVVTPVAGFLLPVVFMKIIGGGASFCIGPVVRQKVAVTKYLVSPRIILAGTLGVFAMLSLNIALISSGGTTSLVASLAGMASAFEIVYGIVVLREKPEPNQLVGAILLLLGVFALLYLIS